MARSTAALGVVLSLAALVLLASRSPLGAQDDDPFGDGPAVARAAAPTKPAGKPIAQHATDDVTAKLEAKIVDALQQPTKMEFTETPLQDAVDFLADLHGIAIQLDIRQLQDAGIGSDTPVTRNLSGVSLRAGLKLILSDLDLTTHVRDGVLLITTRDAFDAAEETRKEAIEVRAYDVNEMVAPDANPEELADVLTRLLPSARPSGIQIIPGVDVPGGGMGGGMGGMGGMGGGMFNVAEVDEEDHADDKPVDKKSVTRHVGLFSGQNQPKTTIVPYRNLLLVRAPVGDHDEITRLLTEIKQKIKPEE